MNKTLTRFASAAAVTTFAGAGLVIAAAPAQAAESVWDKVAYCESTNNWSINTGNGFYGGLQFTISTWNAFGGQEFASRADYATKAEQIIVAQRTLAVQGPGAWPKCSVYAGLTKANGGATYSASSSTSTSSTTAVKAAATTTKASTSTKATTSTKASTKAATQASTKSVAPKKAVKSEENVYTVQAGDSLWKIARAHGLNSWESIYTLNQDQIDDPDLIYVGQRFVIG